MKLVVTADLHVHPWRLCSRDGGHDRLMDGLSCLRQSLDLARVEDAVWVFAGDLKQPKNYWPQSALTGVHEILRDESYEDVEKVMVAGNHDAWGEGGTGLAPFKDCATVVEEAEAVYVGQDVNLVCAPWDADLERVRALLKEHSGAPLVAHGFLRGCVLGPEDVRIAKGTPVEEYGDFPVAFFGDVHKAQVRRPGDPRTGRPPIWAAMEVGKPVTYQGEGYVFYAGSPYQQNWGERNDAGKGALLVDLVTRTVELRLLKAPQYRHFEFGEGTIQCFLDADEGTYYEDFVRVVYTGKPCAALDEVRQIGDKFRSFQLILCRPESSVKRTEIHAGMSSRDMLARYVEARPPAGLDPARTLEAGVRLVGAK